MLGKIEGKRSGQQRRIWLDRITYSMDLNLSKFWERWRTEEPGMLQSMRSQRIGHDLETEQQLRPQVNYSSHKIIIISKAKALRLFPIL